MESGRDTADDYRKLEREAIEQAQCTEDPEARQGLLRFAQMWAEMARAEEDHAGPKPGGRPPQAKA